MPTTGQPSVLIVEDEFIVAMDLEQTLLDASWNVIGPVPDVAQALAALGLERPDAVCLDMNLKGDLSFPIAAELKRRGIPFVILTGYRSGSMTHPAYRGAPVVHKPFLDAELVAALTSVIGKSSDSRREPAA